MKSYAFFVTCPWALLIQHLYAEIFITFYNFKNKFVAIVIILSGLLSGIAFFFSAFSSRVCIEFFLTAIITVPISSFIGKFEIRKNIDSFESHEKIVIYPQMLIGLFWCIMPFLNRYEKYAILTCEKTELILSQVLYVLLGLSYVFFNRLFFNKIYNKLKSNNSF